MEVPYNYRNIYLNFGVLTQMFAGHKIKCYQKDLRVKVQHSAAELENAFLLNTSVINIILKNDRRAALHNHLYYLSQDVL